MDCSGRAAVQEMVPSSARCVGNTHSQKKNTINSYSEAFSLLQALASNAKLRAVSSFVFGKPARFLAGKPRDSHPSWGWMHRWVPSRVLSAPGRPTGRRQRI